MLALVVGATGMLGASICARLRQQGLPVRGLVRPGSSREALLAGLGVQIVYGDLKDPVSVTSACRGVAAVISTATSIISKRPGDSLRRVDRDGQLALLDGARQVAVRRYLFVSASSHPSVTCPFLQYKHQVEDAVRASGLDWTILRPGPFMETSFSPALGWDIAKGKAQVFGSGTSPISYISREDVAAFAALALPDSGTAHRTLPLGGPQPLSQLDAVRIFEQAAGRPFLIKQTPVWILQLLRRTCRPFSPKLSSLLALGVATARGCVIDMAPLRTEFHLPLTAVRDFAEACVHRPLPG